MSYIQQYENLKQMLGIKNVPLAPTSNLNTENNIFLYNTLSRNKEKFMPIDASNIRIYSCGPTVYHYVHLGNLRSYVFANLLQQTLKTKYNKITHVINITDVGHNTDDGDDGQDKMEKGAQRENKTVWEIAKYFTDTFFADLESLNINKNNYTFPRATDYIDEQIKIVKELEDKGYTYIIDSDGVYFDTSKFSDYAKLAKLDMDNLREGARVEFKSEKRNASDFALWKFSPKDKQRQMEWPSPWGIGFPGWHIECSAMSRALLGKHFDIHTGGIDHIPVHHTNEIAQSECSSGEKFVNYWMHNNFLSDKSGKMSKSNDDFLRLETLTGKNIPPLAYKYYLYTTHYRSEINFSLEALEASAEAYKKIYNFVAKYLNANASHLHLDKDTKNYTTKYYTVFLSDLYDDLNSPQAIATIWEMLSDKNISDEIKINTILKMDEVLGLDFKNAKIKEVKISDELKNLLEKRKIAKENKDWTESDKIRKDIENMGYILRDNGSEQELLFK